MLCGVWRYRMKKRVTAIICSIALIVTVVQTMAVEGKNKGKGLLSINQVYEMVYNRITNRGGSAKAADNVTELTINDGVFYDRLVNGGIKPKEAIKSKDGKKISLNMSEVTNIEINFSKVEMTDENKQILETLFTGCTGLTFINLSDGELKDVDFSGLSGKTGLTTMYLYHCGIVSVPDLNLPALTTLVLSDNKLSSESILSNLTENKLPNLTKLYLDSCEISDVGFITGVGKLEVLSLGDNRLTNDSVDALISMKDNERVSSLKELYLGMMIHKTVAPGSGTGGFSLNKFDNLEKLALLTNDFKKLTLLDLSGLRITSLEKFKDVRNDIEIDFRYNKISDFTGLEGKANFVINRQQFDIYDSGLAKGWENELSEDITKLIKKITDENSIVHGKLIPYDCSLSKDYKKIVIKADAGRPYLEVIGGKLSSSRINFYGLIELTAPEIPQNLTAMVGDKLSQVELPDGFEWKDSSLDVGEEGVNTFPAGYTKKDKGKNYFLNIDIPVTVKSSASNDEQETPSPETPTPVPETQTPIPETQAPSSETPSPEPQTPTPQTPTPTPETPTPVPQTPTPTPKIPTQSPQTSTPIPQTPTPKPDESKLTGNQIEKRTDLPILLAMGKQKGKSGIKLVWNKWSGCTGYEVYWSYCDGKQNFKKLKTVKSNGKRVCVHNKLKKTRAYKYYIATYRIKNGRKNYISKSSVIHVAMKQEKHTNVKNIKLNKTKLVLKPKKKFKIKATAVAEKKKRPLLAHEPKFRYYTGNKEVAAVTKNGVVKARKKGTCTIFVIANNGVAKTVKVTVK